MNRAAVLTSVGSPLVIEDIELPPLAAGEVHVRLAAAGVCHSDLSLANGTLPQAVPAVLGHEAAGTVVTVGPGVTNVQPGANVLLNWSPSCGRCWFCLDGEPYLCEQTPKAWRRRYARRADGSALYAGLGVAAFGEETIVPSSAVLALPANVDMEKAALLGCAMLTGIGAVTNSARVQPGESVVVFGTGGVGLSVLQGGGGDRRRHRGGQGTVSPPQRRDGLHPRRRSGCEGCLGAHWWQGRRPRLRMRR